jgi:dTDP-glucose 4,6-dehydratase
MRNVLVTGGAGFIGSNFVRYLLGQDPRVNIVNLDALTYAGSLENLKDLPSAQRHKFVRGDINDRELVAGLLQSDEIDTIVHFAAETHVDRSISGPDPFIRANIQGTFSMLEAARQVWKDRQDVRFHHVSTDEVYGSLKPGEPAWTEATPYAPNSPYAASKASSDHLVRSYGHTYGLPITISNCSNNYGPFQFPEKLFPLMILNAQAGKPLPVYGDGQQIRDWLYVEDHCEAIHAILASAKPGETYNIGGGNQPANLEIVETICDMLDEFEPSGESHHRLVQFVADRPGHDRRYAMDITKIQRELGWQPRHSLTEGIQKTVAWYLSHPEWAQAIQKQKEYQQWIDHNYTRRP